MADSLILADQFELLGGGVASTIPACAGAIFRLLPGFDLSAPQPDANMVQTLLDGERPVGGRFSNRTPTLPIVILSPSRAITAAAKEMLVRAISAEQFTLTWLRDTSLLPMVIDGYQAQATTVDYDIKRDKLAISNVTLSFSAGPFGRNDVPAIVEFPTPLVGKTGAPVPVSIDDFSTGLPTGAWTSSPLGPGPQSAHWTPTGSGVGQSAQLTRSGLAPINVSAMNGVAVAAGFGSSSFFPHWGQRKAGPVTFAFTLSDGTRSATTHVTKRVKVSNNSAAPHWQVVQVPIPQGGSLNLAAITGYTVKVSARQDGTLPYTDLYLDTLQATPYARSGAVQPNYGVIYNLAGIAGSARSAFSLALQMPAGTSSVASKKFTVGGPMSWLAPLNLFGGWAYYQVAGGGGKGGIGSDGPNNMTAGGGGAENAGDKVPVTPGTQYGGTVPFGGAGNSGRATSGSLAYDGGTLTAQGGGNVADNGITGGLAGGPTWTPLQQVSGDTSTFEGGIANWAGAGNCTVAQTAAQFHAGTHSLQLTSQAAGDMTAASCLAANIKTQGEPCMPAIPVVVGIFSRAAVSARSVQAGAEFYDINGTSLGQLYGSAVANSAANFTTHPTGTVTPPAGSVWLRRLYRVQATAAAGEVDYGDDSTLTVGYAQAGGTGGAGNNAGTGGGAGGGGGGGTTGAGGNGQAGSGTGAGGTAGAGALGTATGGAGGRNSTGSYPKKGNQAGGGGGGWEGGLAFPGGVQPTVKGGLGEIAVTWLQTTQFKSLVVHRPGFHMPDTFCPFVPVDQTDTPDGTIEYDVPQLITGQAGRYGAPGRPATFSIYAVAKSWANPATARLVTVQVNHYEQQGGTVYTKQVSLTITPNNLPSQLALLGELTLPDVTMPDDNVNSYFTWTITSAQAGDRFQELLMLDTMGSSIIVQSPTAYSSYFIDAPVGTDVGQVMGSQFDRGDAVSVLQYADVSGPPLHVDPLGYQGLLCYVADAQAPAAELNHYPAWMLERLA